MKLFSVYAVVDLLAEPAWLRSFRKQYDSQPYVPHITLKQPCYIGDDEAAVIHETLGRLFNRVSVPNHRLDISFEGILPNLSLTDSDHYVMLAMEPQPQLEELQMNIIQKLGIYTTFVKPLYAQYESQFRPHLTIGRNLDKKTHERAFSELPRDHTIRGLITRIELLVTRDYSFEEAMKRENITTYSL